MGSKKNKSSKKKSSKKKNSKKNVVKNVGNTNSIKQIRQPYNINEISQPKSKELTGSNSDSENQSDNLSETDDKTGLKDHFNTLRKPKIVSETFISDDIVHKDSQSISETTSNKSFEKEDIQRDDSAPRSSQDENNPSTSKSKSGRKRVNRPTTVALKELNINDDNFLRNQKNENLQKTKQGSTNSYIGKEEIKLQLLRPERLNRREVWHSYENELRSPTYMCRFQIKERKIFQERSKKTLIKKVHFYKFVEVKQVTRNPIDRGNIKFKTQNRAVKIWFTGITEINTTNNKKPEGNPIATNIVYEDRTCDIHVIDPEEY